MRAMLLPLSLLALAIPAAAQSFDRIELRLREPGTGPVPRTWITQVDATGKVVGTERSDEGTEVQVGQLSPAQLDELRLLVARAEVGTLPESLPQTPIDPSVWQLELEVELAGAVDLSRGWDQPDFSGLEKLKPLVKALGLYRFDRSVIPTDDRELVGTVALDGPRTFLVEGGTRHEVSPVGGLLPLLRANEGRRVSSFSTVWKGPNGESQVRVGDLEARAAKPIRMGRTDCYPDTKTSTLPVGGRLRVSSGAAQGIHVSHSSDDAQPWEGVATVQADAIDLGPVVPTPAPDPTAGMAGALR